MQLLIFCQLIHNQCFGFFDEKLINKITILKELSWVVSNLFFIIAYHLKKMMISSIAIIIN